MKRSLILLLACFPVVGCDRVVNQSETLFATTTGIHSTKSGRTGIETSLASPTTLEFRVWTGTKDPKWRSKVGPSLPVSIISDRWAFCVIEDQASAAAWFHDGDSTFILFEMTAKRTTSWDSRTTPTLAARAPEKLKHWVETKQEPNSEGSAAPERAAGPRLNKPGSNKD